MRQPKPGLTLSGRFKLVRELGHRGSGTAWLADDAERGERVVVRFVPAAWRAACQSASRLAHPNILRVHGFHESESGAFVSLQYIDGTDLAQRPPPSRAEVIDCALSLCDALEYAHRAGIVHGDIRPDRVLRDASGHCYLDGFVRGGEPATVTDDVHGLGTLIRALLPREPDGSEMPRELSALVTAMLDPDPARRPAGIAAVRSALEDLRNGDRDETIIAPRRRNASGAAIAPRPVPPRRQGLPTAAVLAGLAVLIVIVIGVVFVLPEIVEQRGALVPGPELQSPPAPATQKEAADTLDPAVVAAQRARADELLGELLSVEEKLLSIGIDRWGGADWSEAVRLAEAGHAAYRERAYDAAMDRHRQALERMRLLDARAPEAFARALAEGNAALLAADQAAAVQRFEIALSIQPLDPDAQHGLQRALRVDRVLAFMAQGADAERAGDWPSAESSYRQALELDAEWPDAAEALARVRASVAQLDFEKQMAAGFGAVQRQDYQRAREAFRAALKIDPGNAAAREALAQVDADIQLGKIVALRLAARSAEADERWTEAVRAYEDILAVDPGIEAVRADLQRARDRVQLDADLAGALADADRFYEDQVAQQANAVLTRARAVADPGPGLSAQSERLADLLRTAATPVRVSFESDNLTDVVIYKVGRLGIFSARTIELKPGVYVAAGTRDGYRDVRRSFRVAAGGAQPPIYVACEEPI